MPGYWGVNDPHRDISLFLLFDWTDIFSSWLWMLVHSPRLILYTPLKRNAIVIVGGFYVKRSLYFTLAEVSERAPNKSARCTALLAANLTYTFVHFELNQSYLILEFSRDWWELLTLFKGHPQINNTDSLCICTFLQFFCSVCFPISTQIHISCIQTTCLDTHLQKHRILHRHQIWILHTCKSIGNP